MNRTRLLVALTSATAALALVVTPGFAAEPSAATDVAGPVAWAAGGVHPEGAVNVVLVGYDKSEVGDAIRSALPASSDPWCGSAVLRGVGARPRVCTSTTATGSSTPRSRSRTPYFGKLADIATVTDRTSIQTDYNHQKRTTATSPRRSSPSTPRRPRRSSNGPRHPGWASTPSKAYTVFLVNWYGRDDFRFHVYRKTDTVDPDTGYNFGTSATRGR